MLGRAEFLAGCGAALALAAVGCRPGQTEDQADAPAAPDAKTRGLDAALIVRSVVAARALPRLSSLIIARHGETLVEERLRGPALDQPTNIKSASKSVIAALTGIAIGRGVLRGVDQPVAPLLRDDLPSSADPRLERITIAHLLSMRAGLDRTSGGNYGAWVASPNWVRYALARPFVDDPGGRMLYSTGSSHLMSAVLTRASGRSTHDLAQAWLAEPLGIAIPEWPRDPQGIYFGGNDMLMSPLALVRFGELYRNDGQVGGRQILPANWVERSWTPQATSPYNGFGYGFGWFAKRVDRFDVRFAWGYAGQMVFVVPALAMTVVMTSDPTPRPQAESHLPALHELLDRGIIPAAVRGRG